MIIRAIKLKGLADFSRNYFGAAFGPDGQVCREYMARLSRLFDPPTLRGDSPLSVTSTGQAERSAELARIPEEIEAFGPIIERNLASEEPCWAQSWAYLSYHAQMATMLARALEARAAGRAEQARERWMARRVFVAARPG